jgi:transcription antitermination factor NusG
MTLGMIELPWYVIRLRSNFERTASLSLQQKGYETYLPVFHYRSRNTAGRMKESERPVFPGYTFCRLDVRQRLPILQSPGVVSILGSPAGPIPIENHEVEDLKRMLASDLPVGTLPLLSKGQYVVVSDGPLTGIKGFIVEVKARLRIVLSISLLNRSVYAEVDHNWVQPIAEPIESRDGYLSLSQKA